MSKEQAEQFKQQGNSAFTQGRFPEAIQLFTKAINICESEVYYTNRAACYLKQNNYQAAMKDGQKAYHIKPEYHKGAQRLCEAYIRLSQPQNAIPIAQRIFDQEMTSKNRELLLEAQRADRLINSPTENFEKTLHMAAVNLLQSKCSVTVQIHDSIFPVVSTAARHASVQSQDDFSLEMCKLMEATAEGRDKLDLIGLKQLPDDYKFIQTSVPTFKIPPLTNCLYYTLMHIFRQTAESFTQFDNTGFITDDEVVSKDKNYYFQKAQGYYSQSPNSMVKQVLGSCISLIGQQIEQAQGLIAQLAKQGQQFVVFINQFQQYSQIKDKGTEIFKQNKYQEAADLFEQATVSVCNFSTFSNPETVIEPYSALLYLSAMYMGAQTLSNEAMSFSKLGQNSKSLALLKSSTFLDPTYGKAHLRAAQIFYDAQMFLEAEKEYSLACQAMNDKSIANNIKTCQQAMKPYMRKDYYAILGVDKGIDCDSDAYSKAYKKICLKWHPDRHARDNVMKRFAELKFRQIQEADGVLRDKRKRQIYDAGGDPENEGSMGGSGMGGFSNMGGVDISDIIGQMMGGGTSGFPGNVQFTFSSGGMPGGASAGRGGRSSRGRGGQQGGQGGMPDIFSQFFGGF